MRKFLSFVFLLNVLSVGGQNSNFLVELDSRISYNIISCRSDSLILDSDTLFLENENESIYNSKGSSNHCDSNSFGLPKISFYQIVDIYNQPERFNVFDLNYRTEWFHDSVCFGSMSFGFSGYCWTINDSILVLEPWDWKRVFIFQIISEENKKYLVAVPQPWFGICSFEKRKEEWHPPLIYPSIAN